jgi:hypothetical protein
MPAAENLGFTDRCIARLQHMSIEDGVFASALHAYLVKHGRIAYDLDRNLFWVKPTSGQPQIAVWMMPVCIAAERRETSCQAL